MSLVRQRCFEWCVTLAALLLLNNPGHLLYQQLFTGEDGDPSRGAGGGGAGYGAQVCGGAVLGHGLLL